MKNKIIIVFVILFLFPCISQSQSQEDPFKRWKEWLNEFPLPEDAIELELQFSFPSEELELEGIYIANVLRMSKDKDGNIYMGDTRLHQVFVFDSQGKFIKKVGQKGEGPGDFFYPAEIMTTKESIIVKESNRLQFFNKNWETIKIIKPEKRYRNVKIGSNGYFYAKPLLYPTQKELIEVLSQDGTILKAFGEPLEFKEDKNVLNFLSLDLTDKQELYVAFEFFPIIRKYSAEGKLIYEKRLENELMLKKEKRNLKSLATPRKGSSARSYMPIIHSIRTCEDGFYIMNRYPRLEIWLFDENGNLKRTYWCNRGMRYFVQDFVYIKQGNEILFYVLSDYTNHRVDVYGVKR